ncbi:MAG: aspartate carbamoyltransferase regulatory subunit [Ruminococcaceae bacterium]|nr:aspartate carbamoyltransferase regulatory subunit [Oscillospiraceae bacterium]
MNVDEIKNGVVIDHIKAGQAMEIYKFLGLDKLDCTVAIIKNAISRRMGKKDIIKIDADITLDLSVLGYIDHNLTINVIKDGVNVSKYHPELPLEIVDIVKCKNPRCITSTEQELSHVFKLTDRENKVYRCVYCESQAKI